MTTNALPRKILFWSAGAIALAVLAWQAMRDPVQMASVVPVSRGPLEQSFLEEGKTRLKQRYVITAPLAGVVRRITLQPGDAVKALQVVAEIDPTGSALLDPRARSQALAEVSTGESALNAAREEAERLRAAAAAAAAAESEQILRDGAERARKQTQMILRAVEQDAARRRLHRCRACSRRPGWKACTRRSWCATTSPTATTASTPISMPSAARNGKS